MVILRYWCRDSRPSWAVVYLLGRYYGVCCGNVRDLGIVMLREGLRVVTWGDEAVCFPWAELEGHAPLVLLPH